MDPKYQNIINAGKTDDSTKEKVLEVKDLRISFKTDNGKVQAVRGVSFDLYKGETLCIVGESGSGKSVTSKAIMGILSANAIVEGGQIIYEGEDLLKVSENEFHRIRGHKIGMIFQDPLSSLNPIVKIGKQITETMMINKNQLKNRYNDLISKELTAYKNNKVIMNTTITYAESDYAALCEEEDGKVKKAQKDFNEAVAKVDQTEKAAATNSDLTALKQDVEAKKVILDKSNIEAEKAKADAKVLMTKKIKQAKTDYKAAKPALKAALAKRKKEASLDNKQYKAELTKKKDADVKVCEEKKKGVHIDQSKVDAIDKELAKLKRQYYFNYIKTKKRLRSPLTEKYDKDVEALTKKRAVLTASLDAINAEEDQILRDYENCVKITKAEARRHALEIMKEVGIPQPEKRYKQYPFQFSGGMRQRIVIAIALTAAPDILICDEPTTALDVTIQAQILELINNLKTTRRLSCIFITHDLGVVANMADRVAVMYAGKICEYGTDKEIFFDPRHPYTWALLSSIPDIDSKEKLEAIPGTPPDMIYPPAGDAFAQRNRYAMAIDFKYQPPYFKISDTHYAATWLEYKDAPKVEMPKIVSTRINKALEEEAKYEK
jgi:oligopeptide transport system ATP-binding protein